MDDINELLLKLLNYSIGDFINEYDGYYCGILENNIVFLRDIAYTSCSEFNIRDSENHGFKIVNKIELEYISTIVVFNYIKSPVKSHRIVSKEDLRNCYPMSHYYSLFVKRIPINNM